MELVSADIWDKALEEAQAVGENAAADVIKIRHNRTKLVAVAKNLTNRMYAMVMEHFAPVIYTRCDWHTRIRKARPVTHEARETHTQYKTAYAKAIRLIRQGIRRN